MISYPEEVINLLEENYKFKSLNYIEKNDLIESIKNKEVDCLDLIKEYEIYEILLQCESNSKITGYLKNNIIKIFKEKNKYNFDLAISYIYNNNEAIEQEEINVIANSPENLSFVAKELIFETDKMEIKSINSDRALNKIFAIDKVKKQVEEITSKESKTKK